jgi:ribosomal protein S18 acetylase RimI-like enzyme
LIDLLLADLDVPSHANALLSLLNDYAQDPMGGGVALPVFVRENLIAEMRKRPTLHAILAFCDGKPAGLLNCIEGFSTFAAKPLLNIHDVIVLPAYRQRGIARAMLARAEQLASALGCCKLTLEVLEGNVAAQALYRSCGYAGYALDPAMGHALFWQKPLAF